jgi:hypothetical protein
MVRGAVVDLLEPGTIASARAGDCSRGRSSSVVPVTLPRSPRSNRHLPISAGSTRARSMAPTNRAAIIACTCSAAMPMPTSELKRESVRLCGTRPLQFFRKNDRFAATFALRLARASTATHRHLSQDHRRLQITMERRALRQHPFRRRHRCTPQNRRRCRFRLYKSATS